MSEVNFQSLVTAAKKIFWEDQAPKSQKYMSMGFAASRAVYGPKAPVHWKNVAILIYLLDEANKALGERKHDWKKDRRNGDGSMADDEMFADRLCGWLTGRVTRMLARDPKIAAEDERRDS